MRVGFDKGAKRAAIGFLIVVFLFVLGVWVQTMPWSLDRQLLVVAGATAIIFIFLTANLLTKNEEDDLVKGFVATHELFSELYKNSPVPYVRAKKDGAIIDVNSAAIRLFGQTKEELVDKVVFDYLSGDEKTEAHVARIPNLVGAGNFINDQEAQFARQDGELRWVILSAFPYDRGRETLVTLVDITKQKNIDTAKSEFVSLASHQLRTPIASIKWNMELLSSPLIGTLSEKQQEYAGKVTRSATRMGLLINDFLDASKLEMGTFESEPGEIVLAKFLDDQLEELEVRIKNKNLTINKDYSDPDLKFTVDSHLLRMTFNNLASNAVKYTPEGGAVNFSFAVRGGEVHITVSDSGMGIPEEDQEKLFGKFFRASNTRDTLIEGTGIGLYIVKQAVKKMHGTLSFGSKVGVGTKFVVSVPLS